MRPRARSGMTLIEVLVATAASAVIFGAVLTLYDTTSRLSLDAIRREGVWGDARQLSRLLDSSLRGYVAPEQLGYSDKPRTDRFDKNGVEIFHADPAPGATVWKLTVQPVEEGTGEERRRGARAERVSMEAGNGEKSEWNYGDAQTELRLNLRYAYSFEGLQPVWSEEPRSGARPLLVQYEIVAQDVQNPRIRARVSSAVALGR